MRSTPALIAAVLLSTLMTTSCTAPSGSADEATPSAAEQEGSGTPSEPVGEVYVLDLDTHEGDSRELSLQRPESLTLTEFSWAQGLEWQSWGGTSAVGTGRISGMFCADGCDGDEYEIALVLCEVSDDHYRRFGVFGDFPEFDDDDWAFGGPLYIGGEPAGDDDWHNGCEEPEPGEGGGQA